MEAVQQLKHNGHRHTPLPTGSYVVGCTDIMTPPNEGSEWGSFIRLFYPAEGDNIVNYTSQWPLWIPDPMYLDGLATFMKMRPSIFKPLYRFMTGEVYVPAIWNGQVHRKLTKCPVIVFSHGLGGCRSTYSTICTELASYGFVVAAVEHRDQSACASLSLVDADETTKRDQEPLRVTDEMNSNTQASKDVDVRDTMDSTKIFPRSLKQKWVQYLIVGKDDNLQQIRNQQVHQRADECLRAFKLLESLNNGEFIDNLMHNDLSLQTTFRNLMDTSQAAIVGHSFGGATVARTLGIDKETFKLGVALDAYMLPVENEVDLLKSINVPVLCINTEKFRTAKNSETLKNLEATEAERVFVTMLGTVHQNQADTPFISSTIGRAISGSNSSLDRFVAMAINNALMLNFLWKHLRLEGNDDVKAYAEKQKKHLEYGIHI